MSRGAGGYPRRGKSAPADKGGGGGPRQNFVLGEQEGFGIKGDGGEQRWQSFGGDEFIDGGSGRGGEG